MKYLLTVAAVVGLSVACLPGSTALSGMLTYSALITLFFLYLGIRGGWVGPLLWPVAVLHAVSNRCRKESSVNRAERFAKERPANAKDIHSPCPAPALLENERPHR